MLAGKSDYALRKAHIVAQDSVAAGLGFHDRELVLKVLSPMCPGDLGRDAYGYYGFRDQ